MKEEGGRKESCFRQHSVAFTGSLPQITGSGGLELSVWLLSGERQGSDPGHGCL